MTWTAQPAPLPISVTPVTDETVRSYLSRLADANHVPLRELLHQLSPPLVKWDSPTYATLPAILTPPLDRLAALTRRSPDALAYALPETRNFYTGYPNPHLAGRTKAGHPNTLGAPCQRCIAAKGITEAVTVWLRHDQNVCLRHRRWTGGRLDSSEAQFDLTKFPELMRAQQAHTTAIRRHGHTAVRHAIHEADTIRLRWIARDGIDLDSGRYTRARKLNALPRQPVKLAYTYPEQIELALILMSPHWRQRAIDASHQTAANDLLRQLRRNGLPYRHHRYTTGELHKWINVGNPADPDDPDTRRRSLALIEEPVER